MNEDSIQDKADAVFSFKDILPGYQRISKAIWCITPSSIRLNCKGRQYIFNKSLYSKHAFEGTINIEEKAFANTQKPLTNQLEHIDNISLYSKAWCNDENT